MWKTIGVSVLRCGAIYSVFGVFGVVYYAYRWSRSSLQGATVSSDEPSGSDPAL